MGICGRYLSMAEAEPVPGCCYPRGPHFLEALDPQPGEALGKDLREICPLLQRDQWDVLIRKNLVLWWESIHHGYEEAVRNSD